MGRKMKGSGMILLNKLKKYYWSIALVSIILGIIVSVQYRIARDIQYNEPALGAQELTARIEQMKKERDVLQAQLTRMRGQLDDLPTGPLAPEIKEGIEPAIVFAGVSGVTGSGVEVTLQDSSALHGTAQNPNFYIVHNEDILKVVNELKAAGAEAIAVNEQRLTATSGISCSGPVISINNTALVPPFVITAVGSPDTMAGALNMRGGVAEFLQFCGIEVSVKKLEKITIPAYSGSIKLDYTSNEKNNDISGGLI
ncbi:DUF881 domain-containing protein [Pelotomaculum propionicicum]|uniref:DUF881 domain-containing protein n=1 Tax=Pelotomaculum propionicicum TaxID=258475 RepID=UPI003B7E78B1